MVSASRPRPKRAFSMDRAASARLSCFTSSCEVARLSILVIPFHGHDGALRFPKRASVRVAESPIVAPLATGLRPAAQEDPIFHAQTPALAAEVTATIPRCAWETPPSSRGDIHGLNPSGAPSRRLRVKAKHFRLSRLPGNPTGDLLLWTFCSPSKSSANWVPIDRPSKLL